MRSMGSEWRSIELRRHVETNPSELWHGCGMILHDKSNVSPDAEVGRLEEGFATAPLALANHLISFHSLFRQDTHAMLFVH